MDSNTRNYMAHGGNELVIGGKLTFLPGATVEGAEGLFDLPKGAEPVAVTTSEATTVAALREDFNHLLDTLRTAGVIR
nr:MAG TPA: Head fiber protein triple repeating helix-turn-helix, VIRAL.52A [Caudoviricetes sp.]